MKKAMYILRFAIPIVVSLLDVVESALAGLDDDDTGKDDDAARTVGQIRDGLASLLPLLQSL